MKVSAYHSSNPSDPDVHHDHSDCPTGQQIPERNKASGTGGFPAASNASRRADPDLRLRER